MNRILKSYRHFAQTFINDLVIFSDIFETYQTYLKTIFQLFIKKNIDLSIEKSYVEYLSIELFGYYIDAFDVHFIEQRI